MHILTWSWSFASLHFAFSLCTSSFRASISSCSGRGGGKKLHVHFENEWKLGKKLTQRLEGLDPLLSLVQVGVVPGPEPVVVTAEAPKWVGLGG